MSQMRITNLPELVDGLSGKERELFERIYRFYVETGRLSLPETMRSWAIERFGSCEEQKIVRVTNRITLESTLFNELRARRPIDVKVSEDLSSSIERSKGDAFCNPLEQTPSDVFGRIEGKYCITASNIAKYDYMHAVIIFKEHSPFIYDPEKVYDCLNVADEWFKKTNESDGTAIYPFFMWNCLWKAGASIIHGHAQALISKEPYARQEFHNIIRENYTLNYGSEYLEDVYAVHKCLGLAFDYDGVKIVSYLTPVKEKEVVMLSDDFLSFAKAISLVLRCYYRLGVRSFNLAIFMPPLSSKDTFVARIVDRGDLMSKACDIGGMELYAGTSVVSSDPFRLVEELKR